MLTGVRKPSLIYIIDLREFGIEGNYYIMESQSQFQDVLPRDVQLQIYKAMDMDARIRAGLVFKLRVPDDVRSRLMGILKHPITSYFPLPYSTTMVLDDGPDVHYIIRRFTGNIDDIVICTSVLRYEMHRFDRAKLTWLQVNF